MVLSQVSEVQTENYLSHSQEGSYENYHGGVPPPIFNDYSVSLGKNEDHRAGTRAS